MYEANLFTNKIKQIKNLLFILLTLFPLIVSAQLAGRVVNTKGQEVKDAEIYISETNDLLSVNEDGYFELEDIDPGTYTITVISFEYNTVVTEVTVPTSSPLIIQMEALSTQLSEVQISARREELFAMKRLKSVEGTTINSGKKNEVVLIGQSATNLASNNARQIYAQVVGLNIYDSNDAGLQLNIGGRGLDPNRTSNFNTRQNGYDISADVLGYPESYYTPPAEALKEIQVIRGAAALQYGTQFGGLVNFVMNTPSKKPLEIKLRNSIGSFGLINNFLSLGGTKNKISYYGYFQYKQGDGFRPNSEYGSRNGFFTLAYQMTDKTRLKLDYTKLDYLAQQAGGLTDIQFELQPNFSNRERNWFDVDWNLYSLRMDHEWSSDTKASFQVSYLDASRLSVGYRGDPTLLNQNPITALDEQDVNGNYIHERDIINGTFKNVALESKLIHTRDLLGKSVTTLVGNKVYISNNTSNQGPGSRGVDADFNIYTEDFPDYANQSQFDFPNRNVSLFAEQVWRLSEKLEVTPGIRWEYIRTESQGSYNSVVYDIAGNPIANTSLTDNRQLSRKFALLGLGVSYQIKKSSQFYGNISQNYRSVTFSDIRVVSPSFRVDPDIQDESGFTVDMGLRGKFNKALSYDVGAFTILYNDRIGVVFDDRANRVRQNIGKALIYGIESFADYNLMSFLAKDTERYRLNVFINGAVTGSQYLESDVPNVEGKQVEFIPAVNVKTGLRGGYRNLLLSLQYSYLSEQYTDVENSQAAPLGDSRNGIIGPVPSYGVMDLSTSYRWKVWKIETGINNLLDKSYYTRRATGYPGPGIIPSDPRSWYVTIGLTL